jgi:hypothetical protein
MKQHALEANLPALLVVLFLTATGIILMFMPRRIQRIAALDKWGPFTGPTLGTKFMRRYIESRLYVWNLRFAGALALVFAGILLYALLFH